MFHVPISHDRSLHFLLQILSIQFLPQLNQKQVISSMGVSTSLPEDFDTSFTAEEVTRLAARFRKIDSDKSGTISVSEFLSLPELGQNPLARRIIGKL